MVPLRVTWIARPWNRLIPTRARADLGIDSSSTLHNKCAIELQYSQKIPIFIAEYSRFDLIILQFTMRFLKSKQLRRISHSNPRNQHRRSSPKSTNTIFTVNLPESGYHSPVMMLMTHCYWDLVGFGLKMCFDLQVIIFTIASNSKH